MKPICKSKILYQIGTAINAKTPLKGEWLLKQTNEIVSISMNIKERDWFIDENGIKWVREGNDRLTS